MSTVTDATSGTQFAASISELNEIRSRDPGRIKRLLVGRRKRELLGPDGRLMIIACDHPARGALSAAGKANAMASRTDLLDRLVTALTRPGVDGSRMARGGGRPFRRRLTPPILDLSASTSAIRGHKSKIGG